MLKMALKIKARALDSHKKTAALAAEVAAEAAAAAALAEPGEPPAPPKRGHPKATSKSPENPPREVPPEKFLTEKERRKLEKKLLEQRRKAEREKEKERKRLEKMQRKQGQGKGSAREAARGPEGAAADAGAAEGAGGAGEGAGFGGTRRAWAEWDSDSGDEDDAYYTVPRVGGVVWRPGPLKAGALSAHLPLVVFLVFSVRSPSWVLNFLLQKRTEQGRGCGFVFGATCCFRMFLGCAFFSYWGGRAKRRGRGRPGATGAFGSGRGAGRRGRAERLI